MYTVNLCVYVGVDVFVVVCKCVCVCVCVSVCVCAYVRVCDSGIHVCSVLIIYQVTTLTCILCYISAIVVCGGENR